MFGKNTSSGTNVDVNVTLDLNNPSFAGSTTINELAIADSGTTITGANSHELHFNNTDGYYAFHINNYPYFYITQDACYVNTTLAIDSNDKQILFYREHNFWFFNANNNDNKLIIKSGSGDLPTDNNWNNYAFEFYQNGDFTVPGNVDANKLMTRTMIHFGDTDGNTDDTYIQKKILQVVRVMHQNSLLMLVMMVQMLHLPYLLQKKLKMQIMSL